MAASNPSAMRSTLPALEVPVRTNAGIARKKIRQQRHDVIDAEGQTHADLEHPCGLAPVCRNARDCRLQFLYVGLDCVQETLTGLGEGQPASAALEQPDAQVSLQRRDIAAHGRRGQRQPPRRSRETTGLRAADERFEVCKRLHELPSMNA